MTGVRRFLANVGRLGVKELRSLRYDPVLLVLVAYSFSFSVYSAAEDAAFDVENAAIAIVDEDRSPLSRRIIQSLRAPYFKQAELLEFGQIDAALDEGRYMLALVLPSDLEAGVLAGDRPSIQLDIDATAVSMAGRAALYVDAIVRDEVARFLGDEAGSAPLEAVRLVLRARFNPNLDSRWFQGVIEVVTNITIMSLLLAGAAVIREREHGTLEHLLTMPVRPTEIMVAKVWANGLVILLAALLSLHVVVRGLLGVPIAGSTSLFAAGAALYLSAITALGIFLSTMARSMPQFGLLAIPIFIVMILLSGTYTPLDSMPEPLQWVMRLSPSTHFTSFAKGVLFRAAGPSVLWPDLAGIFLTGSAFFVAALIRFRASVAMSQS